MAQTLKFGNKTWATKVGSTLAYNDENGNYKPLPFAFTRSTSATRVNKEGLIEVVTNDRPRIDYTDTSDGVLLLEKAATNLITNSEKFVDTPTGATNMDLFSGTIINNDIISPDGNVTAMKFTVGASGSSLLRIYQSDLSTSSQTTFSVYAKKGTTDSLSIDITDVTLVNSTLTDEWQRISVTDISTSSKFIDVQVSGNSGEYIYIWGLQAETNSVASSYIPTQGSATTRVAETASGSGNSEVFNDSEGVLFANIAANANDSTYRNIGLTDNTINNRILLQYSNISNRISGLVIDGSASQSSLNFTSSNIKNYSKVALKYKVNDVALWVNGFEIGTDTSVTMPSGLNTLSFDNSVNSDDFYGKTKELGYYDTILTDLELETLTSYKSWTSMVNELNLNIIYNG